MEWTNLIPWGIAAISLIVTIMAFYRNSKKDLKQETVEEAQQMQSIKESLIKVNMKLDQLCTTTTETRTDIKAMNEYINTVEKRVAVLEENVKAVWVRIDELKARKS